jgi:pentapeptide MXKDX repeat protein
MKALLVVVVTLSIMPLAAPSFAAWQPQDQQAQQDQMKDDSMKKDTMSHDSMPKAGMSAAASQGR